LKGIKVIAEEFYERNNIELLKKQNEELNVSYSTLLSKFNRISEERDKAVTDMKGIKVIAEEFYERNNIELLKNQNEELKKNYKNLLLEKNRLSAEAKEFYLENNIENLKQQIINLNYKYLIDNDRFIFFKYLFAFCFRITKCNEKIIADNATHAQQMFDLNTKYNSLMNHHNLLLDECANVKKEQESFEFPWINYNQKLVNSSLLLNRNNYVEFPMTIRIC